MPEDKDRTVELEFGWKKNIRLNPIDPNPAVSARAVFPQSGHIRPEKRPFFQKFPHFSKIEP